MLKTVSSCGGETIISAEAEGNDPRPIYRTKMVTSIKLEGGQWLGLFWGYDWGYNWGYDWGYDCGWKYAREKMLRDRAEIVSRKIKKIKNRKPNSKWKKNLMRSRIIKNIQNSLFPLHNGPMRKSLLQSDPGDSGWRTRGWRNRFVPRHLLDAISNTQNISPGVGGGWLMMRTGLWVFGLLGRRCF